MFGLYCSRRLGMNKTIAASLFCKIRFFSTAKVDNKQSFSVSYLINSFGFSSKTAESISKRFYFDTPEKPDSVLLFFKEQGFTISQISKIVTGRPQFLLANPKTTLLPKLEFFRSIGVPSSDLSIFVSKNSNLLCRSLSRHIIPCYDILRSAVAYDDEKAIKALKRYSRFSESSFQEIFNVNLSLLRETKVPQSAICVLVTRHPTIMCLKVGKFAERVKKVLEMGFDPSKQSFVIALRVFLGLSEKTWHQKEEVFRRLGFSEDEFLSIFRKNPLSVLLSEKNIISKMDFLVHKMGWRPAEVARFPTGLCYSLETRIIPRCSVVRVLLLKGLIKEDITLSSVLTTSEKYFLERFVIKYQEEMPQLLDLLKKKVSLAELGFGFEEKSGILGQS